MVSNFVFFKCATIKILSVANNLMSNPEFEYSSEKFRQVYGGQGGVSCFITHKQIIDKLA